MDKKKILVIDDEKGFTDLVKEILEETGKYEVETVNSGRMGLSAVRAFKPDLILLDVMMPDMDGTCVADKLKNGDGNSDVSIVFVSALFSNDPDDVERSSVLLPKPVGTRELIECVEKNL